MAKTPGIHFDDLQPTQQLNAVKMEVVTDIVPQAKVDGISAGYLTLDSQLLVRNRGAETRRNVGTLPGAVPFLKIGSKSRPLRFTWVSPGNWEDVFKAAQMVYQIWERIAPVRTGNYRSSMIASAGGKGFEPGTIPGDNFRASLDPENRVLLVPVTAYSATLEANFRQGILLFAIRSVRRQFGTRVAMRLEYALGIHPKYAVPVAAFGLAGSFASVDSKGRRHQQRRRAREARRAARR